MARPADSPEPLRPRPRLAPASHGPWQPSPPTPGLSCPPARPGHGASVTLPRCRCCLVGSSSGSRRGSPDRTQGRLLQKAGHKGGGSQLPGRLSPPPDASGLSEVPLEPPQPLSAGSQVPCVTSSNKEVRASQQPVFLAFRGGGLQGIPSGHQTRLRTGGRKRGGQGTGGATAKARLCCGLTPRP